jgi:tetratricopeptide (TPR) repeat protein
VTGRGRSGSSTGTAPGPGRPGRLARDRAAGPLALALALLLLAPAAAGAEPPAAAPPAAATAALERALAQVAAGAAAAALPHFEEALAAAPDELRWGAEYRQAIIASGQYDRAIAFFQALVGEHPEAANAWLNLGYAHVDKIPAAGAVTQVILANRSLGFFTAHLEREETWLGRYTRGNSYVYWPTIFGKAKLGVADLERALELAAAGPRRPYHVHAWVALGDGHWRLSDLEAARRVWEDGLARFPGDPALTARLEREGEALEDYLDEWYAMGKRVATDLRELWEAP